MEFELRELRYFVALAEELHFGRAAERVGIEQSPLSKAITVMERNMGVQLFVRTRKATRLTPMGQALLEDARRILEDVDLVQRKVAAAATKGNGKLRVGVCSTLATLRVGRLLSQCRAEEPDLDLSFAQKTRHELRRELHAGLLDVALVSGLRSQIFPLEPEDDEDSEDSELQEILLWEDGLVAIMRADHRLAKRRFVDHEQDGWRDTPVLIHGESHVSGLERTLRWLMSARDYEAHPSLEFLLTRVTAGYGIGLVSAATAEGLQRDGLVFRPVRKVNGLVSAITRALWRPNEESETVMRFIKRAKTLSPGLPGIPTK